MIWFRKYALTEVNTIFDKYMTQLLGIKAIEINDDSIIAAMPITDNVRQPFGILHGGASVVLAESIGSVASNLIIDPEKYAGVGLDINANHVRSASEGMLTATCSALHIGKTTHVWDIKMHDDNQKLICISRLTVAIIEKSRII
ncbi:1,4-dihydroxy-2-naphthoyl-CoA hydrolase [Sphingobacterium nematocida]|uniref:1,4-dihydroxy-2-naphthoyl-CoA hydrolase n=1 Tax=Sphingobacterium nematocida TaxID=1513896 RepID=A0A1T5ERZ7_9SPHI|nr:hotdog fold thioesterase [Sphingobacterium nematocida]SKB86470.1 1,4-dihydroxy-2-naphthoyl-CoA hydrolase [Sphingobacterium nematocida]